MWVRCDAPYRIGCILLHEMVGGSSRFPTTSWSTVLAARAPATRQPALQALCSAYWSPVYAFVRRRGYDPETAQDLTQAFFARMLEKRDVEAARHERGRFRSFLLASVKHFLTNEWDKGQAQKRGGGTPILPFTSKMRSTRFASNRPTRQLPSGSLSGIGRRRSSGAPCSVCETSTSAWDGVRSSNASSPCCWAKAKSHSAKPRPGWAHPKAR